MKWLLDEMLPRLAAQELRARHHDAASVFDVGLVAATDDDVFAFAVSEGRCIVTENFGDFATLLKRRFDRNEPTVPVVFVRKGGLPLGGALPAALAARLDDWSRANPNPYVGPHCIA